MRNNVLAVDKAVERIRYCVIGDKKFSHYSNIYPFATDNLDASYKLFDLEGKKSLLVCGSGDQPLNAGLLGSREIDVFDINFFSLMFFQLKLAAVKALSYEEFFEYFYLRSGFWEEQNKFPKAMNEASYDKIKKYLTGYPAIFWEYLYSKFSGFEIRSSYFFLGENGLEKEVILSNTYLLNETNFKELKRVINDIKFGFKNVDIMKILKVIKCKYDFIDFSNISYYVENLKEYANMVYSVIPYLNNGGAMIASYIHGEEYFRDSRFNSKKSRDSITNYNTRCELFPDFENIYINGVAELEFMARNNCDDVPNRAMSKDCLLLYRK